MISRILFLIASLAIFVAVLLFARSRQSPSPDVSLSDVGPLAFLEVDVSEVPVTVKGRVPNEIEREDILADLAVAFDGIPMTAEILVEEGASMVGWPGTLVPLLSTVRDYVGSASIRIDGTALWIQGEELHAEEDRVLARLLGSAPGLILEADFPDVAAVADIYEERG